MFPNVLHVALGGAIGASARYGLGVWVYRFHGSGFPLGVLAANVIGSFVMGVFIVWAGRTGNHHLSPFIATGILGGFTTFSAFSLETVTLYERGALGQAALYVALSVSLSLAAIACGLWVARQVVP